MPSLPMGTISWIDPDLPVTVKPSEGAVKVLVEH
jgi:hypothetical protein